MKKIIYQNDSIEKNLRDTKHNKKVHEVFLKLLAKQKKQANPFGDVRAETLSIDKSEVK